jgi:hypothetical protein
VSIPCTARVKPCARCPGTASGHSVVQYHTCCCRPTHGVWLLLLLSLLFPWRSWRLVSVGLIVHISRQHTRCPPRGCQRCDKCSSSQRAAHYRHHQLLALPLYKLQVLCGWVSPACRQIQTRQRSNEPSRRGRAAGLALSVKVILATPLYFIDSPYKIYKAASE